MPAAHSIPRAQQPTEEAGRSPASAPEFGGLAVARGVLVAVPASLALYAVIVLVAYAAVRILA